MLDDAVLQALAGDIGDDGVLEVVSLFLSEAPAMLDRMERASVTGGRQLLREVHTLASAARNVGLLKVGDAAAEIETSLRSADAAPQHLNVLLPLLRDGVSRLEEWRAQHLDPNSPATERYAGAVA